jgi:hypothetical protein
MCALRKSQKSWLKHMPFWGSFWFKFSNERDFCDSLGFECIVAPLNMRTAGNSFV